jgi:hypothetical protein
MPEESTEQVLAAGAYPTARDFVVQLAAWGFRRRDGRRGEDGVHLVYRGPRGGTLRVLRSLYGRADAELVAKAARFLDVTPEQFWAGPAGTERGSADAPAAAEPAAATSAPAVSAPAVPTAPSVPPAQRRRSGRPRHDRITSIVLAAHTAADRPLGFDQVVQLCGGRATRAQVLTASATLCRDGDLDRIRSGVYQWAGGVRATHLGRPSGRPIPAAAPSSVARVDPDHGASEPVVGAAAPVAAGSTPAADLFGRLFPDGVQMTAELLADLERWTRLTERLVDRAHAS